MNVCAEKEKLLHDLRETAVPQFRPTFAELRLYGGISGGKRVKCSAFALCTTKAAAAVDLVCGFLWALRRFYMQPLILDDSVANNSSWPVASSF